MPRLLPARPAPVLEKLVPLVVWLAAGLLLLRALHTPPARTFTFEPETRPRIVRGLASLWPAWSGPRTELLLHGLDGPARIVLRFKTDLALAAEGARLQVRRGPRVVADLPLPRAISEVELRLDEGLSQGAWLTPQPLELRSDRYGLGREGHARGIRLEELRVEPVPGPLGGSIVWRAGWLTLVVVLLTLLAGAVEKHLGWGSPGRTLRVSAVAALAGALVAIWAHRDPWSLAFWLPPLPTAFTLLGLFFLLRATRGVRARIGRVSGPALAALVAAQGLLFFTDHHVLGVGLVVLGLAVLDLPVSSAAAPPRGRWMIATLLLLLLALGLRLHRIQEIPFGMWRDEARHGLVALGILEDPSYRPIYVAERSPKLNLPGFGLHLLAPGLALFGITPWSMRVVTAVAGALTVLPAFFLARRLFGSLEAAFLGALFLACSFWHLIQSRWAFPTAFDPLFAVAGLALLAWAFDQSTPLRRGGGMALGGVLLGLAVQTYHSGRVAPVAGAGLLYLLGRERTSRARWPLAFAAGLGLTLLPLLLWVARHRAEFSERVGEVSLLTQAPLRGEAPLAALDMSLLAHLQMWNVRGDPQPRHNLPGHPMLDPVTGLAFLVGVAVVARRRGEAPHGFVLLALLLGVLPSLLALDGPNGMRAVAAIVPTCLVAGVGAHALLSRLPGVTRILAVALLASAVLALNAHLYFVRRAVHPRVAEEMYPADTGMGVFIRAARARGDTETGFHVPEEVARESVLQFLAHGIEVRTFDREGQPESPWREGDWFLVADRSEASHLEEVLGSDPRPDHVGPSLPGTRRPSFLGYRAPTAANCASMRPHP